MALYLLQRCCAPLFAVYARTADPTLSTAPSQHHLRRYFFLSFAKILLFPILRSLASAAAATQYHFRTHSHVYRFCVSGWDAATHQQYVAQTTSANLYYIIKSTREMWFKSLFLPFCLWFPSIMVCKCRWLRWFYDDWCASRCYILRRGDNNAWQPLASRYVYRWGAYVAVVNTVAHRTTTTDVHGSIPLLWVMMMTMMTTICTHGKVNTPSGCDLLVCGVTIAAIYILT